MKKTKTKKEIKKDKKAWGKMKALGVGKPQTARIKQKMSQSAFKVSFGGLVVKL